MYCRVHIISYSKSIHICDLWCKTFFLLRIFCNIHLLQGISIYSWLSFLKTCWLLLLVYVLMKFKWVFVVTFFHLIFLLFSQDNTIVYWRKFVAEYYSPRAKKRWCLSLYDNVGHHALGVFPQAAMVIFFVLVIFSFYFKK